MKKIVQAIRIRLICTGLWLVELVRWRDLKILIISHPPALVVARHPFLMQWQVQGCYKIVINGRFTLPGNVTATTLDPGQFEDLLEIRFFGTRGQFVRRFKLKKYRFAIDEPVISLPSIAVGALTLSKQPVLLTKSLCLLQVPCPVTIHLNAAQPILSPPVPASPVLNLHLTPYHLQPTLPNHETQLL